MKKETIYTAETRPCYQITYSDGNTVTTSMNCGLQEAVAYFKSFTRITEDSKGKESSADAIAISLISDFQKGLKVAAKVIAHGEEAKGELIIVQHEDNKDKPFYLLVYKVDGSYFVSEFITGFRCGTPQSNKADALFNALNLLRSMNWVSVMQGVNSKEKVNTLPADLSAAKVIYLFSVRNISHKIAK